MLELQDPLLFNKLTLVLYDFPIGNHVSLTHHNWRHELRSDYSDTFTTNPTRSNFTNAFFRLSKIANFVYKKYNLKLPNQDNRYGIENFSRILTQLTTYGEWLQNVPKMCLLLEEHCKFSSYFRLFWQVSIQSFSCSCLLIFSKNGDCRWLDTSNFQIGF